MTALDVARAAMRDAGENPALVWADDECPNQLYFYGSVGQRAAVLGVAAAMGVGTEVRCADCAPAYLDLPPCTPVRDVLRGVTCQSTFAAAPASPIAVELVTTGGPAGTPMPAAASADLNNS